MRGWIRLVIVVILLGLSLFLVYPNDSMDADIDERDNIIEYQEFGNHTVYIEEDKGGENRLKIVNSKDGKVQNIEGITGELYGIDWSNNGKYFIVNKATDIVKTTYLVSMENFEKLASIPTIGKVIWSPDSSKLLIGVENNKKRAVKGELKGTVDLAIYYVNSKTVEPLLEADEYVDYWPEYWDSDNNIGYRKINGEGEENLSIKYEPTEEELVMDIIYSNENHNSGEGVIKLLPKLDFNRLEYIYGEGSVLDLLEWLSHQEFLKEEELVILINLIDEFVGEEYYKFVESIANNYLKDKVRFLKALSKVPEKTEDIALGLHDMKVYDRSGENIFTDLDMILNSEELTEEERQIGVDLISFYASCST
ncbi:hypothetical protein [Schnuerera ultunensis]|uniref:hypothetical protein n=1 Tax=Schnuerera ultunensis TaxID=45497 RepID=UPI00041063FF|nr:hypothetical protein [Schnuerera ultunensis]